MKRYVRHVVFNSALLGAVATLPIAAFAGGSVSCPGSVSLAAGAAGAAGAVLGVNVFDPSSFAAQVQQVVNSGCQLLTESEQLQQFLQNAKALGSLQSLMSAYGISPSQLTSMQLRNLISDVYSLSASDPNWDADITAVLKSQGYTTPVSASDTQTAAGNVYSGGTNADLTTRNARTNRDLSDYSSSAKLMSDVQEQMATIGNNLNQQQIPTLSTLTDTSQGASLHAIAAGQVLQSQQADASARLATIMAHAAMQRQMKEIERESLLQQSETAKATNVQQWLQAPITDVTANPVNP